MRPGVTIAVAATAVLGGLLSAPRTQAQDANVLKGKAHDVVQAHQDAVVHVKIAMKQHMSFGGQDLPGSDTQVEVTGTVIHPSGLVVLSESDIDPMGFMMSMMGGLGGGAFGGASIETRTEVNDVKIVLKDGKETAARLVLRDKDLDLAFVAPQEKGLTLPYLVMEAGTPPELFDHVFILRRLGRTLDRVPALGLGRVSAIVHKPRTFYVCDSSSISEQLGCPAFDGDGKPIGISVRRRGPAMRGAGMNLSSIFASMTAVILPAEDINEVAEQALAEAAKPPKKESDDTKE